jgi:group I intron endonuclease
MSKAIFVIYKHTSPSGKAYIGQTNNYKKRTNEHKSKSSGCRLFACAIKKYGWDSFSHEILAENLTVDEANRLEAELIIKHNTIYPNGYNLRSGGLNSLLNDDSKKRISESKKGIIPSLETRMKRSAALKGRIHTEKARRKLSIAHTGKTVSPESRAKMSLAKSNISEETRRKMSEAAKRRIVSPETIAKRSKSLTGHSTSQETRAKISATLKGHSVTDETRKKMSELAKMRQITPETRAKMNATRKANYEAKKLAVS